MAPTGTASQFDQAALERRVALQGKAGPLALLHNAKVFGIACFACLGGLLYGYNQGVFSGVLTMTSFSNRKCPSPITAHSQLLTSCRYGRLRQRWHEEGMADIYPRARCLAWNTLLWLPCRDHLP